MIPSGIRVTGKFLSTPSARRATSVRAWYLCLSLNFYPRPPRGGRPGSSPVTPTFSGFLSTPSARRATLLLAEIVKPVELISIHALREEGDCPCYIQECFQENFYPRPPRGGRLFGSAGWPLLDAFLSTPSARRATSFGGVRAGQALDFYPRPPRGGRRQYTLIVVLYPQFLSTPSARRATGVVTSTCPLVSHISIHALREEGDLLLTGSAATAI